MNLDDSVRTIKGIGEKTALHFEKLGIKTVMDLLTHYPKGYDLYEKPAPVNIGSFGNTVSVYAKLLSKPVLMKKNSKIIINASFTDIKGNRFGCTWFNMPYLCNSMRTGDAYVLRGIKTYRNGSFELTQPSVYKKEEYDKLSNVLMPIYALTAGVTSKMITKAVRSILECQDIKIESELDKEVAVLKEYGLLSKAISDIHFPGSQKEARKARDRIALEEFYTFFTGIKDLIESRKTKKAGNILQRKKELDLRISSLPFELTKGQRIALEEVRKDLTAESPMHRIIQGDVGAGKTIIAFLAMLETGLNGYQSAIMAPTAVLASQHYENFIRLFPDMKEKTLLLTGDLTAAEKRAAYEKMMSGEALFIVGTHALFQEKTIFKSLMLVIVDEQHRFGVGQRHELTGKGNMPHVLYMSATPIPRSLAGILYADLDLTVLSEKPKGRQRIHTAVIGPKDREKTYRFIMGELAKKHQAYVICPLIEEGELPFGEDVATYSKMLKKVFAGHNVGVLHGRMSQSDKNAVFDSFAKGDTEILVSTTVVEVGVDVKNATVIVIENAERFGLAQLHQLRGRVGRGSDESYCILISSSDENVDNERLSVMKESDDGFVIAEKDFKMRGPGDILGVRQSGDPAFRLADIYRDHEIMKKAREIAFLK